MAAEPRSFRSHSTPHALRCNCNERHDPKCRYSRSETGPYAPPSVRPLGIDPRPECVECHELYDPGDGLYGICRTCRARPIQERIVNLGQIREWLLS